MTHGANSDAEVAAETADADWMRVLLRAGRTSALSSDTVMDVLQEAINSDRPIAEIIDDRELLSRRQRDSISRLKQETRQLATAQTRNEAKAASPKLPATPSAPATTQPRYAGNEEIGRGGWGVVYRSRDTQLDRDVAIKQLGENCGPGTEMALRFQHEAKITGQLQHPGIVPVYERGTRGDGQPFFAMKLLGGKTLRDALREFHEDEAARRNPAAQHVLLTSLIDVCHAIAYAHDRKIVHRDLKPSNVIVGEFGETIVVDWGLAKDLGEEVTVIDDEATVRGGTPLPQQSGLNTAVVTQAGALIGTPAFMSPEQARGATKDIDERSDIFSLGAMLYVTLTGHPPFHGEDLNTTLTLAAKGEFRHPRQLNSSVSPQLASICLKAMQTKPQDRYQSAADMAKDLQRFLANEPISCHKDTRRDKLARWCRRRPALAATILVGTAIFAIAGSGSAFVIGNAHASEKQAKQQAVIALEAEAKARIAADEALIKAEDRLLQSRAAADEWLIGLSGTLQRFPGLNSVRNDLIGDAKRHYSDLLKTLDSDETQRLEAARCCLRLGDLALLDDNDPENAATARTWFAKANDHLASVNADSSADVDRETLNAAIGLVLCDEEPQTKQQADTQLATITKLADAFRTKPAPSDEDLSCLARAELVLGRRRQTAGELNAATGHMESALKACRKLRDTAAASRQHLVATVREDLAGLYSTQGKHDEAADLLKQHSDGLTQRLDEENRRPDLLETRAITRMRWAAEQRWLGDDWAAENSYRLAVEDLSESWQLMFGDHFYSENLAVAQANLGQMALTLGRMEDADRMLRDAVDQLTGLMQSGQADRETASRLAACNVSLGSLLVLQGDLAAEEQIKRSLDIFDYLKQQTGLLPGDHVANATALVNLGTWHKVAGQPSAANTAFRAATAFVDSLAEENESNELRLLRAKAQLQLAGLVDAEEAASLRDASLQTLRALAANENDRHRGQRHSATIFLLRTLLDDNAEDAANQEAAGMLEPLVRRGSTAAHVLQLAAIARYRSGRIDDALQLMNRTKSARRFPRPIDAAIQGCIEASGGEAAAARESLRSARRGLQAVPGDLWLRHWVLQLEQLVQPETVDSTEAR